MTFALALLTLAPIAWSPSIEIEDLDGKTVSVPAKGKPTALIFLGTECPIANRLTPELRRIVAAFPKAQFYFVYADKAIRPEEARKHRKDFALNAPAILDGKYRLVKLGKATVTPETAVFDATGKLVYRGRINDSYSEHNRPRETPLRNELRDALSALAAGKPVKVAFREAIGCPIPDLERRDRGVGPEGPSDQRSTRPR
jgi:thiol-disulfide isomerase/thioredoxin